MTAKNHTVWTWHDRQNVVRFVGYGRYGDRGEHPAQVRWDARRDQEKDSELDIWLQSLEHEPDRKTYGSNIVSEAEAVGFVMGLRTRHSETLLGSRGPSTYSGGHPRKGVYYFCSDDLSKCNAFESVRDASRHLGVNASSITRWCRNPKREEWGYIEGGVST